MDMENTGFPVLAEKKRETDTQFKVSKQNFILDLIDAVFDERNSPQPL